MPELTETDDLEQAPPPIPPEEVPPRSAVVAPPGSFQAAMRLPTTVSRTGPLVFPPPNPAQLAPVQWTKAAQPVPEPPNLEQASAAVAAAIKAQALRGYQQDLQSGKSPAEALAKWAPSLYGSLPNTTAGQAASLIQATKQTPPRYMTSGNRIYQVGPQGAVPLTPAPVKAPVVKNNQFDLNEQKSLLAGIRKTENEMADLPFGEDLDNKREHLAYLRQKEQEVRNRSGGSAASVTPPIRTNTGSMKRVWVKSKDGRTGTIPEEQLDEALKAGYTRLNR